MQDVNLADEAATFVRCFRCVRFGLDGILVVIQISEQRAKLRE